MIKVPFKCQNIQSKWYLKEKSDNSKFLLESYNEMYTLMAEGCPPIWMTLVITLE
jgi:hypothetical protein